MTVLCPACYIRCPGTLWDLGTCGFAACGGQSHHRFPQPKPPPPPSPLRPLDSSIKLQCIPPWTTPSSGAHSNAPSDPLNDAPNSDFLQQLLARFGNVEHKLEKIDTMERQLFKLHAIESKTYGLVYDMRHMQGSIDSLRGEVESVKSEAKSTEEKMEWEVAALQAQVKAQQSSILALSEEIEDRVLSKTRSHFNKFTQQLEYAFIKEQAAARKHNLFFWHPGKRTYSRYCKDPQHLQFLF